MQAVTSLAQRRPEPSASRTKSTILEATIATIAKHSLSGTTVQLVAEAAKVAPGTVILHFQKRTRSSPPRWNISRWNSSRRAARPLTAPRACGRGLDRHHRHDLRSQGQRSGEGCGLVRLLGRGRARKVYMERIGALDHAYQTDLERLCSELIAQGGHSHLSAEAVAMGFAGVLEWQWQEILLSGRNFDRTHARKIARAYLAGMFPREFPGS